MLPPAVARAVGMSWAVAFIGHPSSGIFVRAPIWLIKAEARRAGLIHRLPPALYQGGQAALCMNAPRRWRAAPDGHGGNTCGFC